MCEVEVVDAVHLGERAEVDGDNALEGAEHRHEGIELRKRIDKVGDVHSRACTSSPMSAFLPFPSQWYMALAARSPMLVCAATLWR